MSQINGILNNKVIMFYREFLRDKITFRQSQQLFRVLYTSPRLFQQSWQTMNQYPFEYHVNLHLMKIFYG